MGITTGRQLRAALLGVWFVLAGGEPVFAHPCHMPMSPERGTPVVLNHGSATAASADGHAHAQAIGAVAAEHHHHIAPESATLEHEGPEPSNTQQASAEHGSAEHESTNHSQCECVGSCEQVPPSGLLAAAPFTPPPVQQVAEHAIPTDATRTGSEYEDYRQPWSTGPPEDTQTIS